MAAGIGGREGIISYAGRRISYPPSGEERKKAREWQAHGPSPPTAFLRSSVVPEWDNTWAATFLASRLRMI